MSYYSRLTKAFEGAYTLPLTPCSKYVLISDCHRGVGNSNDNFLKNQSLYMAALQFYYKAGFTYLELGDGDELWENRSMKQIIEAHDSVFSLLDKFQKQNRLYLLYGNHDMVKKKQPNPLFSDISFYSSIILKPCTSNAKDIYLTHGHQADLWNSVLWRFTRFLVRYFWKPLERYGVLDPTSAAKNYTRKQKTEKRLSSFAQKENVILIAGHTHRPTLMAEECYCNSGSCVHPQSITCLEIERMQITLVRWQMQVRPDMCLYAAKEILSGPFPLLYNTL